MLDEITEGNHLDASVSDKDLLKMMMRLGKIIANRNDRWPRNTLEQEQRYETRTSQQLLSCLHSKIFEKLKNSEEIYEKMTAENLLIIKAEVESLVLNSNNDYLNNESNNTLRQIYNTVVTQLQTTHRDLVNQEHAFNSQILTKTLSDLITRGKLENYDFHRNNNIYRDDPGFEPLSLTEKCDIITEKIPEIINRTNQSEPFEQLKAFGRFLYCDEYDMEDIIDPRCTTVQVRNFAEVLDPHGQVTDETVKRAERTLQQLKSLQKRLSTYFSTCSHQAYDANYCNVNALITILEGGFKLKYGGHDSVLMRPYIYLHLNHRDSNSANNRSAKYAVVRSLIESTLQIESHLSTLTTDNRQYGDILYDINTSVCLQKYGEVLNMYLQDIQNQTDKKHLTNPEELLKHFFTTLPVEQQNCDYTALLEYAQENPIEGQNNIFEIRCYDPNTLKNDQVTEDQFKEFASKMYGYETDSDSDSDSDKEFASKMYGYVTDSDSDSDSDKKQTMKLESATPSCLVVYQRPDQQDGTREHYDVIARRFFERRERRALKFIMRNPGQKSPTEAESSAFGPANAQP